MFNSSELSTAMEYGMNVATGVFRNDSYGNVTRDLDDAFGGAYGTNLCNPDFVAFAESFSAVGMKADDPMDLKMLIPLALERQVPVIIDTHFGDMPIPRAPQYSGRHVGGCRGIAGYAQTAARGHSAIRQSQLRRRLLSGELRVVYSPRVGLDDNDLLDGLRILKALLQQLVGPGGLGAAAERGLDCGAEMTAMLVRDSWPGTNLPAVRLPGACWINTAASR